jgi:hypothetical protein
MSAPISSIVGAFLTVAEQAKLGRLDERLNEIFHAHGLIVRECRGVGDGLNRVIAFGPGLAAPSAPSSISLRASQFLAGADEKTVSVILGLCSNLNP